jgi:hypothetical protein
MKFVIERTRSLAYGSAQNNCPMKIDALGTDRAFGLKQLYGYGKTAKDNYLNAEFFFIHQLEIDHFCKELK